jgi:predicted nucleic-acid-binding Zn-ribbon protein
MSFKPAPNNKCPKCGKTVYFAEKQVVLGKDWHKTWCVSDTIATSTSIPFGMC